VGGSRVNFVNDEVFSGEIAEEIATDEKAHVALIRAALGTKAGAKPNINLNALGIGQRGGIR
jgi:Ferritin-like domain